MKDLNLSKESKESKESKDKPNVNVSKDHDTKYKQVKWLTGC
jgi:hypothetical protein